MNKRPPNVARIAYEITVLKCQIEELIGSSYEERSRYRDAIRHLEYALLELGFGDDSV